MKASIFVQRTRTRKLRSSMDVILSLRSSIDGAMTDILHVYPEASPHGLLGVVLPLRGRNTSSLQVY